MSTASWLRLLAIAVVIAVPHRAAAEKPTFAELLTKAQHQLQLGHRWLPPGDNVTETVVSMLDIIEMATPNQLDELSALLAATKADEPPDAVIQPPAIGSDKPSSPVQPADSLPPGTPVQAAPAPSEPQVTPFRPATPRDVLTLDAAPSRPPVASPPVDSSLVEPTPAAPDNADPAAADATARNAALTSQPPSVPHATAVPSAPLPAREIAVAPKPPTPGPPAPEPAPTQIATLTHPSVRSDAAGLSPPAIQMKPPKPGPRAAELFERGNQAQAEGDVSGARRYYLVAAEQGSPQAASRLGQLYDPTYLKQTAIGGIDPDPALARKWYERAVELGDAQAKSLLNALAER